MNSSSVQFFPARVHLFGLPPTADALPPPPRPSMARVQRISRNLFGAPAPGAITQLLEDQQQRQCDYVLQRYNFDIKASVAADKFKESSSSPALPVKETLQQPLPSLGLISQELRDHERRLQQQEKCNPSCRPQSAETTPPHDATSAKRTQLAQIRRIGASAAAISAAVHQYNNTNNNTASDDIKAAAASESSIPMGSERLKPYARQTLLPNFFNLRKTKQCNGRTALLTVARSPNHRQLEVLQLPKPMRAATTSSSTTELTTTTTDPAAAATAAAAADDEVDKSTNSDNETLSLQVSTESSPLASAASTSIHPQASLSSSSSFSSPTLS